VACALLLVAWIARSRVVAIAAAAVTTVTLLAGPTAYTVTTLTNPSGGTLAAAGPAVIGGPLGGLTARQGAQFDRDTPPSRS